MGINVEGGAEVEGADSGKALSRQDTVHLGTEGKPGALELRESEGPGGRPSWRGIWVLLAKVKIEAILSQEQLETTEGI